VAPNDSQNGAENGAILVNFANAAHPPALFPRFSGSEGAREKARASSEIRTETRKRKRGQTHFSKEGEKGADAFSTAKQKAPIFRLELFLI
jgi:hypothetical protein